MKKRANMKCNVIKVPKQPDAKQCGFYVLRYMRQIVEYEGEVDTRSLQSMFMRKSYTKAEINEVREEWVSCMLPYMM
ncbi:hypothetical protein ACS0TY_021827 [Phlomoides rotata]